MTGCPTSPDTHVAPDIIYPLQTGNYWVYYLYQQNANAESLSPYDSVIVSIKDTMWIAYEGLPVSLAVESELDLKNNVEYGIKWLYSNGSDGLYQFGGLYGQETTIKKILLLKYPTQQGDSWNVPHLVFDLASKRFLISDSITYDCLSTWEKLTTPAGEFWCTVYHHRIKPDPSVLEVWDYYDYYSTRLGRVGTIIRNTETAGVKFKAVLVRYEVKY